MSKRGPKPRLTDSQVLEIRRSSETYKELAYRYGITAWYVSKIKLGLRPR